jgi:hypothetical protein
VSFDTKPDSDIGVRFLFGREAPAGGDFCYFACFAAGCHVHVGAVTYCGH